MRRRKEGCEISVDWTSFADEVERLSAGLDLGVSVISPCQSNWAYRGDHPFPSASTIKVAIMVAVYRAIEHESLHFDEPYQLTEQDKANGSGVLRHLSNDLRLSLDDLLYLMIAISDNSATNILINTLGMPFINATMRAFGMTNSLLARPMVGRLAVDGETENMACANDFARLIGAIVHGDAGTPDACKAMRRFLALQQNRNRIGRYVPPTPGFSWGSKNGTNPGLTHDVGFIDTPNGTLIAAIYLDKTPDEVTGEQVIANIARTAMHTINP